MTALINMKGKKFGHLTVIARTENRAQEGRPVKWLCVCDCGNTPPPVNGTDLRNGHTSSCRRCVKRLGYIKDSIGYIPLTQGKWALCDAHWFHYLSQWNWHALQSNTSGRWYAVRNIQLLNGKRKSQSMARVIMGVTNPKIQVDHKERSATLDNRKENLRIATSSQNCANKGPQSNNVSGFKGVSWHVYSSSSSSGRYCAQITHNGKTMHLAVCNTAVEAAAIYNFAAKKLHGEFSMLNDLSQVTKEQLEGFQC